MALINFFCSLKTIIKHYKNIQIFIAFLTLNKIITHELFDAYCRVISDSYWYQIINNFKELIEQKDKKNNTKIATLIFLVIKMYIRQIRLLEINISITNYKLEKKLYRRSASLN